MAKFYKKKQSEETPPPPAPKAEPKQDDEEDGDEFDWDDLFGDIDESCATDKKPDEDGVAELLSPAEALLRLTERTKEIRAALSRVVLGQDNAVSVFASGYFRAELLAMTDPKRSRPATFLFAGPPGVGKTFLAENVAAILDRPFKRFDMSEYCDKEAALEFCGSDSVYKNSKGGNFTEFLSENPRSVILFDEIEKAHINIIHLFLQILDAGRIRDSHSDDELSLRDTILIFTTNAGKQLYEEQDGDLSSVSRKVILKALQKDINPATGTPYFPAAICSRFASGNVVMFNHIGAHDLRDIARREVLRHADNFHRETGIRVEIDERVFTALLFAEGGTADARTVRSRAESFFDDELFELFRHIDGNEGGITALKTIRIDVTLSKDDPEITALFESRGSVEVLVFASDKVAKRCMAGRTECVFSHAEEVAEAEECLRTRDVKAVLIDISHGRRRGSEAYLNVEDVDSAARDLFHLVRETYPDLPVYLLQTGEHTCDDEERVSFLRLGVRDVLDATDGKAELADKINAICSKLHHQHSMNMLASANKLVRFETAQKLVDRGRTAEIRLFDFKTELALEAEDSKDVMNSVSRTAVRFDQVIGAEDAKQELKYFVEYLKDPKKYAGTGVRAPRGILLYGPPGTGKTMLAKAMAGESGVTFISAEGNQFLKRYVGEGPEKVHELFRTARKYAPTILFVDEIDAIASERRGGQEGGSEATLTAFLTEMDGFKNDPTKPVFVLAATNFDVEPGRAKSLDPALMRRFDRRVYIDLPRRDDRVRYMKMKIASNKAFAVSDGLVDNIALRSTGMSLAELESVFELSLRSAIREGSVKVTDEIFEEAFETFNSGAKKAWDVSQLERVARHEAGHAFLCYHGGETPSYLTVVARADHGGYMQHGDSEGKAIYTREELLARIRTSLGGRAAELVYYGPEAGISTGAAGDLESATRMAQNMVCAYGMDESFGLSVIDPQSARTGEISREVRAAVNGILREQMEQAVELIRANRGAIDRLVKRLLADNHLTGTEIEAAFR